MWCCYGQPFSNSRALGIHCNTIMTVYIRCHHYVENLNNVIYYYPIMSCDHNNDTQGQ